MRSARKASPSRREPRSIGPGDDGEGPASPIGPAGWPCSGSWGSEPRGIGAWPLSDASRPCWVPSPQASTTISSPRSPRLSTHAAGSSTPFARPPPCRASRRRPRPHQPRRQPAVPGRAAGPCRRGRRACRHASASAAGGPVLERTPPVPAVGRRQTRGRGRRLCRSRFRSEVAEQRALSRAVGAAEVTAPSKISGSRNACMSLWWARWRSACARGGRRRRTRRGPSGAPRAGVGRGSARPPSA